MKVNCPLIVSNGDGGCRRHGCGYRCDRFFMLDVEIPTSALIEELGKRRPCDKCESWKHNSTPCITCFWKGLWNMGAAFYTDNFKEANHG